MSNEHTVYILRCADGSYYVGSTQNINKRVEKHNKGSGSLWTRDRRPIELVYSETYADALSARRREAQIKHWSRYKKEKLINNIWNKKI
jgi:predicted GIY-YIG superfamily endonuclease